MNNNALAEKLDNLLSESVSEAKVRASTAFDSEVALFDNQYVLLGAGNIGRRILARLRADGIEPKAFADNNKLNWGKKIDGLIVLPTAEAVSLYGSTAVFIVTIYNNRHSFPDTEKQLMNLGCIKVVSVIYFRWKYHNDFLPYFRDDLPHKVLMQADSIRKTFHLWSDNASRREFVSQIEWRLNGNFDALYPPSDKEPYFPQDEIFRLEDEEVFVDLGAYDGDTIRSFLDIKNCSFTKIIALEPDPRNFDLLSKYVETLPYDISSKINIFPFASGSFHGQVQFNADEGTSSAVSKTGKINVECHRLDELLENSRPTYIKMDIEGSELDSINGAQCTIREHKPMVAACIYHLQDHLWKIPLRLSELNPTYHFFLRTYMTECWESVCYAIPPERSL